MNAALRCGCLCGAVRYEIADGIVSVFDAGYCHCVTCRALGAPVAAWFNVAAAFLGFTKDGLKHHRSPATSVCGFCDIGGTSVGYFPDAEADHVGLSLTALDNPETVRPKIHLLSGTQSSQLQMTDTLPRYPGTMAAGAPNRVTAKRRKIGNKGRAVTARSQRAGGLFSRAWKNDRRGQNSAQAGFACPPLSR